MENIIAKISKDAYNYIHDTLGNSICTQKGITANINEWAEHKGSLIEKMRKHPNWSEDNLAIVTEIEEYRELDRQYFAFCDDVYNLYHNSQYTDIAKRIRYSLELCVKDLGSRKENGIEDDFYKYFSNYTQMCSVFYTVVELCFTVKLADEDIGYINTIDPEYFRIHSGAKPSRVLLKFFKYIGFDEHPDFNKLFAKISDCLSVKSFKRKAVLSVNPLDFLTMSNGNSWSNCMCLKPTKNYDGFEYRGKHQAGVLSYMTDDVSCLFYTLDVKTDDAPLWTIPKITRQVIFYKYPLIVHERIYPKSIDYADKQTNPYVIYRDVVQRIFAECEDVKNDWAYNDTYIKCNPDCFVYPDWRYYVALKYRNIHDKNSSNTIRVGGKSYCIHCGEQKIYNDDDDNDNACATLLCADCAE